MSICTTLLIQTMRSAAALLETPDTLRVTARLEPTLTIGDNQAGVGQSSPGRVLEPEPELQEIPEVIKTTFIDTSS